MLPINLFSFGYYPDWLRALDDLEAKAQPEPWAFPGDIRDRPNNSNPLLEDYVNNIFTFAASLYNAAETQEERDKLVVIRPRFALFDTGLMTREYAPILAYFIPNNSAGKTPWVFKSWGTPGGPLLARTAPLPDRLPTAPQTPYNPAWPIRINTEHMIQEEENYNRLPETVRNFHFLPLIIEAAVEQARRKAVLTPSIVVPQIFARRVHFLLPICMTDPKRPDLALSMTQEDGYYRGATLLTLRMAYQCARRAGRDMAPWLLEAMKEGTA